MAQQTSTSKKSTTTKRSKQSAEKSSAAKATKQAEAQSFSPDDRFRMIAEAAYLKAEQRGFQGGNEMSDWLQAEAEVDARFASRH